jgi:hypothetical protein
MEGKPELTKVTIGSSNVTDYFNSWTRDDTQGNDNIRSINITLSKEVFSIINFDNETIFSQLITVTRGIIDAEETTIFKGYIKDWNIISGNVTLNCVDKLYLTKKITLTFSYDKDIDSSAGVGSEIFKDLINSYTSLTADDDSVQSTGDVLIDKLIIKSETIYDKIKWLADFYGYMFYYNPETDKVNFEPIGYINNSTTLETGVNIVNVPKWKVDETYIYNEIRVNGAEQLVGTTETGRIGTTSGYTTSSIQLNYEPTSARILVDASNPPTTEKVIGVPGSTLSYDCYVDKTKKQIIFSDSYTPGGTDYVIVEYTYTRPVPVVFSDPDSIENYNSGTDSSGNLIPKKLTLIRDEIKDVNDAESFANEYLLNHKDPIESTTLRVTNVSDLDIGQQVNVIDNNNSKDSLFKISRIKMAYPYAFDEVSVETNIKDETNYLVMIYNRQKQLSLEQKKDFEYLISTLALNNQTIYENVYIKAEKNVISGSDGFILGHPTYGEIGTATLGAPTRTTTYPLIVQAYNRYVELFLNEDFKNASTTADWDTTNNWLELEDTEIAISEYFAVDINSSSNNNFTSVSFFIDGTNLDELDYYIGEFNNSTITYTSVTTSGSSTYRTGNVLINNTNKYGINFKIENESGVTAKITKLIINYSVV